MRKSACAVARKQEVGAGGGLGEKEAVRQEDPWGAQNECLGCVSCLLSSSSFPQISGRDTQEESESESILTVLPQQL